MTYTWYAGARECGLAEAIAISRHVCWEERNPGSRASTNIQYWLKFSGGAVRTYRTARCSPRQHMVSLNILKTSILRLRDAIVSQLRIPHIRDPKHSNVFVTGVPVGWRQCAMVAQGMHVTCSWLLRVCRGEKNRGIYIYIVFVQNQRRRCPNQQ